MPLPAGRAVILPSRRKRAAVSRTIRSNHRQRRARNAKRAIEKFKKEQRGWASKPRNRWTGGCSHDLWRFKYYHEACVSDETKQKLVLEDPNKKAAAKSPKKESKKPKNTLLLRPKDRKQLIKSLRELRTRFAQAQNCEDEFKIFPNKTLQDVVARVPKDHRELRKCWGIGAKRLQQYGMFPFCKRSNSTCASIIKIWRIILGSRQQQRRCRNSRITTTKSSFVPFFRSRILSDKG